MSELRQDPLSGRWVIFAAGRSQRPNEFPPVPRDGRNRPDCPFCPGQEHCTTPEVFSAGRAEGTAGNSPGWRLRVFPNMYAAVAETADAWEPASGGPEANEALFQRRPGLGRHEVVVYSPAHGAGPASIGREAWAELLATLQDRSRAMAAAPEVRYISPFCNHGPEAGATLSHPHMQIIGAPEVPSLAATKSSRLNAYRTAHGRCLLCDLAEAERTGGRRLILATGLWTVWAPWASRFPWEMLLVPNRHGASLNQATAAELDGLGDGLAAVLGALAARHGDPSLNLVLHSAGVDADGQDHDDGSYHWHVEILPRLSRPAGFEVGTGYTINAVLPEDAARWLRQETERT